MTCRIGYTGPNQHLAEHNILFEKRDKEADQLIHNMAVLAHHLLWNQQNGIHVLQLPLIFPRAQMGYDQSILDSDEVEWCVEQIGAFCRKYDQRVAFDLNSLTTGPEYRQRKMQQISFLGELSDRCGVAMDLVVSVGSPFANKSESMDRFKEAYSELPPHTQSLISLTNDPVVYGYTVEELGPLLQWGGIPLTLNLFNHSYRPGSMDEAGALEYMSSTWSTSRPLTILSSPRKRFEDKMAARLATSHLIYRDLPDCSCDVLIRSKSPEAAALDLIHRRENE